MILFPAKSVQDRRLIYNPLSDPLCLLWWDPTSGMSLSGATINTWTDRKAGKPLYPDTSTGWTYDATGMGGAYAAARSNSIVYRAEIGSLLVGQGSYTVMTTARDYTSTAGIMFEYGVNGATTAGTFVIYPGFRNANAIDIWSPGSAGWNEWVSNAGTEYLNTPKVLTFRVDYGLSTNEIYPVRSNGVALAGAYQTNTNSVGTTMLDRILYAGGRAGGSDLRDGLFGDILIFSRALTDDETAVREAWMMARNGLFSAAAMAARKTPRIFWMGQSNAQGSVDTRAELNKWNGPWESPRIWAWRRSVLYADTTETWQGINGRQYGVVLPQGYPGPDLVACLDLVRTYKLAPDYIEYTRGNTFLAYDWQSGGLCYTPAVSSWNTAVGSHPSAPSTPVPVIVWIQGESDSSNSTYAANYGTNLSAFFASLESDIPALAGCRKVIAKLHPNCGVGTPTTTAQIRAAQDAYQAAHPTTCATVEVSDLALQGDNVHYTEAAAITLGHRIAAAIAGLM